MLIKKDTQLVLGVFNGKIIGEMMAVYVEKEDSNEGLAYTMDAHNITEDKIRKDGIYVSKITMKFRGKDVKPMDLIWEVQ